MVLDMRRTWSSNSVDLGFDIRDIEEKSDGNVVEAKFRYFGSCISFI